MDFQDIYQAALTEDTAAIAGIDVNITQLYHYKGMPVRFAPASKLAFDGHDKAVDFLITHGGANVDSIAQAYALAGRKDKVEHFRSQYHANVDTIANSYAMAANHTEVDYYRDHYQASIDAIAHGYAIAGNHEKVSSYHTVYQANAEAIAHGYAMGGYHKEVEEYCRRYSLCRDAIEHGYAFLGEQTPIELCPAVPKASSATTVPFNMTILGGFIAVAGIASVALAFTVFHAATLGITGLVMATLGVSAAAFGLGLFASARQPAHQPQTNQWCDTQSRP
ncbi:MAG: hypothetical protein JJT82_06835 [Legionellaceae bacterium]|nr:hypothetical protein [Legionellaceae bacterium]